MRMRRGLVHAKQNGLPGGITSHNHLHTLKFAVWGLVLILALPRPKEGLDQGGDWRECADLATVEQET